MATQLDLQEQEQLDALKAFWKKQGNLITWVLLLALVGFSAWNGWQYWQRDQAQNAGAMFEELDRAALVGDADKVGRVFADLKQRYPKTAFAEQAGLTAAKVQFAKSQADAAKASLAWVAENAVEDEFKTIARLRLAGLQLDGKQYDEALKTLDAAQGVEFEALVQDRRGDIYLAQGKAAEARAAYQRAWVALGEKSDYRRLVDAKLTALGASPEAPAAAASAGTGSAATAASGAQP